MDKEQGKQKGAGIGQDRIPGTALQGKLASGPLIKDDPVRGVGGVLLLVRWPRLGRGQQGPSCARLWPYCRSPGLVLWRGTSPAGRLTRTHPPRTPRTPPTPQYLSGFLPAIQYRNDLYHQWMDTINAHEGGPDRFTRAYERFGIFPDVQDGRPGLRYREWAPGAAEAWLIGDFNAWDRHSHPMRKDAFGVWELFLPCAEGGPVPAPAPTSPTKVGATTAKQARPAGRPPLPIAHNSKVKISLATSPGGERLERIPAYIHRAVQDATVSPVYEGVFWHPPTGPYQFKHAPPPRPATLRIYESHGRVEVSLPWMMMGKGA